jgi:hypothetical protein
MNQEAATTAAKSWLLDDLHKDIGEYAEMFYKHMEFLGFDYKQVVEALSVFDKISDEEKADRELVSSIDNAIKVLQTEG